jgi:addiction module RelE/StbE family toxin
MSIQIIYRPKFVRQYKKMDDRIKTDIREKIKLFQNTENQKSLRVHKLHGELADFYSFSVTYNFRIVFEYDDKNTAVLLSVGDHNVYQ